MEALALRMPDCVQEYRRERCFSAREQNVYLSLRFEGRCSFKQSRHILHIQFVDVTGGVGVHVARRTEHVAAVGEVDDQIRTAPCLDAVCTMIVNRFVAGTIEVLAKPEVLHSFEESRMIRKHVFKRAMLVAYLAHQNAPCFLHDLRLDDSRPIPKIGETRLTSGHSLHCLTIAVRAKRQSSPRNASRHWISLPASGKRTGRPRRVRKLAVRQDRLDVSSKGPCSIRY